MGNKRRAAGRRALPTVYVTGRPLREITGEALGALIEANDPPELFTRFGGIARVRSDERGRPLIERVSDAILRHRLERVAQFVRTTAKQEMIPVAPPTEVVQDVLVIGSWPLPPLEAVVEVPVMRPDGTVFGTPGYDAVTRLVYRPTPGLIVPEVSDEPTAEERDAAIDALRDIVVDFPFVDAASRTNTLGLILTPILRPAIPGEVPLALVDKPKRGTGATLVGQLITSIALGSETDLTTAPHDDDEWRKKITASLLAGTTIMFFDNVEYTLSSPSLAAALTSPAWSDRVLGRSEKVSLPQRATWLASGNNIKVGGDLARRCYWVRLDAGVARPWQRDRFKHPNLKAYVRANRGKLLAAALTLARAWFSAGCPKADVPTLGGFDGWAGMIGGVLGYAGIDGFLGNLNDLYEQVDEEEVAWEAFLGCWLETYGDRAMTVADVARDLRSDGGWLRDALPGDLAEALVGKGSFERRLGNALAKRKGAIFGPVRLMPAGTVHSAKVWRVVRVPEGSLGSLGSFSRPIGPSTFSGLSVGGDTMPR